VLLEYGGRDSIGPFPNSDEAYLGRSLAANVAFESPLRSGEDVSNRMQRGLAAKRLQGAGCGERGEVLPGQTDTFGVGHRVEVELNGAFEGVIDH